MPSPTLRRLRLAASLSLLALTALAPSRLHAQALPLLSPTSYALPAGHGYIIGLTPNTDIVDFPDALFNLHTNAEIWGSKSSDSAVWGKIGQWGGFRVNTAAQVMGHPDGQRAFVTVLGAMSSINLYGLNLTNSEVALMALSGPGSMPVGLTLSSDLKFYASFGSNIYLYPNLTTGTPTTVISDFGSQALGSGSAKLAFAGDTLYAFDFGNSRVLRYDANGNFLSEFAVDGGDTYVNNTAFAVSDSGLLFTGRFDDPENTQGTIYRANTGEVVGHFTLPHDVDDPESNGGRAVLSVINEQLLATSGSGVNLYSYDLLELEPVDVLATGGTSVFASSLVSNPSLRITGTGGSLDLSGDSTVRGGYLKVEDGVAVTLAPGATLHAGVVRLEGTAQLSLQTGSELTANWITGGALTLDGGLVRARRTQAEFVNGAITLGPGGGSVDTAGFNVEISASIDGPGGLTKLGPGMLMLTGANTYTGATNIAAGTLVAASSSLAHTSTIIVGNGAMLNRYSIDEFTLASGQTLTGEGSVAGVFTVGAGAHLAPGNGPGTLTFNYALFLDGGAILDFQLGDPLNSAISRRIDVGSGGGGSLRGPTTGLVTINLSDAGSFGAGTYDLIRYSSATFIYADSFIAENFTLGSMITGYTYTLAIANNALQLTTTATAVPEPSAYAAIAGALTLGFAAWRRRHATRRDKH